jgi:hypothetical protein
MSALAALALAYIFAVSCGALLTPPEDRYVPARDLLDDLIEVRAVAANACCSGGTAGNVIDGDSATMWGAYDSNSDSDAYHAHGTGHYLNLDLGQDYQNITRVEYVPSWSWSTPGGYGGNNNGICQEFEIYVSEKPLEIGEEAPAENLAGYGEWLAQESGSNSVVTNASQKFIATFSSVRGRYVQFKFKSAYYNHWNGYPRVPKIAQAAEIKVFVKNEPYAIPKNELETLVLKADALRAAYLPRYRYTNAILDNWTGKGKQYLESGDRATKEMVDYVAGNLNSYIAMAPKRYGDTSYDRFYGEDRTTSNGGGQPGVHGYSSEDLYNWKDEGVVLPVFNNAEYDTYGWKAVDWDGDTEVNYTIAENTVHRPGFAWSVNQWRKALGDWNCDGVIDGKDTPYQISGDLKTELLGRLPWWDGTGDAPSDVTSSGVSKHEGAFFTDEKSLVGAGKFPTAEEAWAKIKDYIPGGNPPLYIADGSNSRPYAGTLGLDSAKIAAFNALYSDVPVWRRKQLYRYYNYQSIIERPKVVYNPNTGDRYKYNGTEYPYVMFVHLEGGTYDSSYGTARVAIAVAKNPQGPFKFPWAYRTHFVENSHSSDNSLSKGMSRDQGLLIDTDGTAYHFGSTEENRFMGISKLDKSFTRFEGIPEFAAGGNQTEMLQEGYQNRLGVNFSWLFGNQREAPAPFVHFSTPGMALDGDGTNGLAAPADANKYYYAVTSYSSGWFPNPQGKYRTDTAGGAILGDRTRSKPPVGSISASSSNDTYPNGWVNTANDDGTGASGNANSLLFGTARDGSSVVKGFDGQTTHVFQLRYPDHPWGIVGYADDAYTVKIEAGMPDVDPSNYLNNPGDYYTELEALAASKGYTKPIYGERIELDEPRKGKLVYGKYIYLSDSWDQHKNYDACYIWLPMRALADVSGNTQGLRVRWMDQWRWQDFVYELGPFEDSGAANPSGDDIWNDAANDITPLAAYYEMLGNIDALKANAGKQNPGLNF